MKYLKLLFAILLPCYLLCSCGSNTNTIVGKENALAASSYTNTSHGNAVFSATIDGKSISDGKVDELQLTNTAFLYPDGDDKNKVLLFDLASDKPYKSPIVVTDAD